MLNGVTRLVGGHTHGGNARGAVHRIRQTDDVCLGVVVVGETAANPLNGHVVKTVGVQHTAGGLRPREPTAVVDLGVAIEGGIDLGLRHKGEDHGGDEDQKRPVAPKITE